MNNSPQTIPALFRQRVQASPDRVAMRYKDYGVWRDISWSEYYRNARRIALALNDMGLQPGDCVAIIGENMPEWVYADLGIQSAGGVSVGIYTTNAAKQVKYIVNHSEAKFFFVENEEQLDKWLVLKDEMPTVEKVIVWDRTGLRDFSDEQVLDFQDLLDTGAAIEKENPEKFDQLVDAVKADDLAVLIYTSGTTGPPKGAMLTHKNVLWVPQAATKANPITANESLLSFLPLCHIYERVFGVFAHITFGYTTNFVESLDTISYNMREVSPTIGYAVPRIWEKYHSQVELRMEDATWFKRNLYRWALKVGGRYADFQIANQKTPPLSLAVPNRLADWLIFRKLRDRLGFRRMNYAYTGAAPIAPDVLRFLRSIGLNILEGYGQTESSGISTASTSTSFKLGTVGKPLEGLDLKIADDGEILVRSPGVFKGYYKDPEGSNAVLRDGWLHTGDVGEIDDDGFVKIVDRKKDIIITAGGKNIAPQFIENQLKFSPYINDAVVIGDRRKFLSALIVLDEDNVSKYAQDHKIPFATYTELATSPDIIKLIEGVVDATNNKLSRVENVRKFRILPKKLYEEDGDVTPTMKVKRKSLQKTYQDLIESMYQA